MTLPKQINNFLNQKVADFLFTSDPLLEMLKWLLNKFMRVESEMIVGAEKNSCGIGWKIEPEALIYCIILNIMMQSDIPGG